MWALDGVAGGLAGGGRGRGDEPWPGGAPSGRPPRASATTPGPAAAREGRWLTLA